MKKQIVVTITLLAICLILLPLLNSETFAAEAKKVYKWRGQSQYGTNSSSWLGWLRLKDLIESHTEGRVILELFPAGQLAKPRDTFDAVSKGLIEVELGCLVYESGKVAVADISWLPYAWENPSVAMFLFENCGIMELYREALARHNMYYLCPTSCGSYGFMTKFPLKKIEDLKGKKIHSTGMAAKVIQAIGATAVPLAAPEVYTALQRGTVEGTCWPFYTLETYKFAEVVEYLTFPPVYTPSLWDVMINMDRWKELPEDLKQKVNRAGRDLMPYTAQLTVIADMAVVDAAKRAKMKVSEMPAEEVAKIKKAVMPLWDVTASKDKINAEIIKILKNFKPKPRPIPCK